MADLSQYRVLASDKCDKKGIKILTDAGVRVVEKTGLSEEQLCKEIPEYDGLLIRSGTKVTQKVIEAAERLTIIARAGVGVNNVHLPSATKQGVVVVNSPEGNTLAAAEHTWAMLLSLSRQLPQAHNKLTQQGIWDRKTFMGTEMAGKTLGVVGFGRIGRRVCQYARGMDMEVLAYDPFVTKSQAQKVGARLCDLDELLSESDMITLHMPATKETTNMIDDASIAKMKKGTFLVNVARGELVDEAALFAAVKSGHLGGVGLDVYKKEPPNMDSALFSHPKVITTPHLGASTKEAQVKVAIDVCEQMVDVFRGGPARSAVNIPSMRPELMKPVEPWITIAEKLGRLVCVLVGEGGISTVNIEYAGDVGKADVSPLTTVLLKGLLTRSSNMGAVNFVNAPLIAKERGLKLTSVSAPAGNLTSLITVRVFDSKGKSLSVSGTSFGELGDRLVQINDIPLEIGLEGQMLFVENKDVPGALGDTCSFLSRKGINIADLSIGRKAKSKEAMQAMRIDSDASDELTSQLTSAIDNVSSCIAITFIAPDATVGLNDTISATMTTTKKAKL